MKFIQLFIFLLSFVLCLHAAAQEEIFSLEEIEQSEGMHEIDFDQINELEDKIIENNITIIPPSTKDHKTSRFTPPIFRALLKRGAQVESLAAGDILTTDKEIFVRAQQKVFGDSYAYILNSQGKWVYRTKTINLASIEKDVELGYPKIKANEKYEKSFRHNLEDTTLKLDHRFTFSLETMEADLYKDLFNASLSEATASRLEWRTFYKWQVPLEFGLSLTYQDGNYAQNTVTWQAFHFGPLIRYPIAENDNITFKLSSGVQKSAIYKAVKSGNDFYLTSLTWHIDLDVVIKSQWGQWIVGLEYRNQNTGVSKDLHGIILDDSRKESIKSLGFVFGREFNFLL